MQHSLYLLILLLHVTSLWFLGWSIIKKLFKGIPFLLHITGALFVGTGIGVPITYFLSCLFVKTGAPILWGTVISMFFAIIVSRLLDPIVLGEKHVCCVLTFSDVALALFSLTFGFWVMFKTFHGGAGGQLFVGSNNVFDFGFSIGLMRSMSWGSNIPIGSPFFAGFPLFYHFFFNFWTALWEYFGVPTVWAMNVPSTLSFAGLLIIIYFVPQIIAKQKQIVGWISVLLTITNSSLTFWQLILKQGVSIQFFRALWRLPTYPFAGPFDGSTISIFLTLNNYVNQRHLAFAIALALFMILLVVSDISKKQWTTGRCVFAGCMTGILLLWNMVIYLLLGAVVVLLFALHKQWKSLVVYICISGFVGFLVLLPIVGYLYKTIIFLHLLVTVPSSVKLPSWNIVGYLWENLGLLPVFAMVGFLTATKNIKKYFVPFILLFLAECLLASIGKRGFEQKTFSFLIIGINILAAMSLGWMWQRKVTYIKLVVIVFFAVLTISGVVDLFPIKNEFAYPLVGKDMTSVVSWIHNNTPKNSIFVSYEDMIDPVVLGGRNNYYGFFQNIGAYDRSPVVRQIYQGDVTLAKREHISYILVPKGEKSDFSYVVNNKILANISTVVYQDNTFLIYGL